MNRVRSLLIAAGLLLKLGFFLELGCRSSEKRNGLYDVDGGYVMREECDDPGTACHMGCIKRKASLACATCCRDQRFLCDMQQAHSFASCEGTP